MSRSRSALAGFVRIRIMRILCSTNFVLPLLGAIFLLTSIFSILLNALVLTRATVRLSDYCRCACIPMPICSETVAAFEDEDYPSHYPIPLSIVSLTPENTVHYQIYTTDASSEWGSVFPPGGGFLYLGASGRPFGLSMFHQLHCLNRIRQAMETRKFGQHVHHCFNYLRQTILCGANPTLEPVVPILGVRSVNAEVPRVCRDWTAVYELVEKNFWGSSVWKGTNRTDAQWHRHPVAWQVSTCYHIVADRPLTHLTRRLASSPPLP